MALAGAHPYLHGRVRARVPHRPCRLQITGAGAGLTQEDIGLKNSVVYGRMNWLGFEAERFTTTPHFEQQGTVPGSHLPVTTAAFNVVGVRYLFTQQVALFAEYKYNRATFEFDTATSGGGLKGDYSASHVVGGLSFHF
jgi:opacity protein-like surface antigen